MNTAASAALRAITATQMDMGRVQQHIASGYRVGTPGENAAYWSIATTMRSDVGALGAAKDALGLGSATAGIAMTGLGSAIKVVDQIKQKLIAAREPGVDRGKIQSDITALQGQLHSVVDASGMSGQNWLTIDSTAGTNVTKQITASVAKDSSGAVTVNTIGLTLYDAASGDSKALVDTNATASAKVGILDKQRTMTSGATYNILSFDIHSLSDSAADMADLDSIISGTDDAVLGMTSASTEMGTVRSRIDIQSTFLSDLKTAIDQGVSELVDADMNAESTRLQALQTKQNLGMQVLSMANSQANTVLKLFQ